MRNTLLNLLPEGCSHTVWGRWCNAGGNLLGLHGQPLLLAPQCSEADALLAKPLVLFMGGSADSQHKAVLNYVYKRYYTHCQNTQAIGYGTFHQVAAFMEYAKAWHEHGQKIVLIGHSYGGYGVMSAARQLLEQGIPIELLITLDPVACSILISDSVLGKPDTARQWQPSGLLKNWLNVYVDYDYIQRFPQQIGMPNIVALKGGPLKICQFAHRNLVLPVEQLGHERYVDYAHQDGQAMFQGLMPQVAAVT